MIMYACMQACRHVFTHGSSFFWVCCMSNQKPRQEDWVMLWVTASSFGAHNGDMSNTQDPNKDRHLELLFHLQDSELRIATDILVLQSWTRARTFTPRPIPISVLDTWVGHQVQQVDDELGMPPLPDHADNPQSGLEEVAPSFRISTCGRVGPIHVSWSDDPNGRGPPLIIGGCL